MLSCKNYSIASVEQVGVERAGKRTSPISNEGQKHSNSPHSRLNSFFIVHLFRLSLRVAVEPATCWAEYRIYWIVREGGVIISP